MEPDVELKWSLDRCLISGLTFIYQSFIGHLLLIVSMVTLACTNRTLKSVWKSMKHSPLLSELFTTIKSLNICQLIPTVRGCPHMPFSCWSHCSMMRQDWYISKSDWWVKKNSSVTKKRNIGNSRREFSNIGENTNMAFAVHFNFYVHSPTIWTCASLITVCGMFSSFWGWKEIYN